MCYVMVSEKPVYYQRRRGSGLALAEEAAQE